MSNEYLRIIVSENGSRVVTANIRGIGQAAAGARPLVQALRNTLLLLATGESVLSLTRYADELQKVSNRLTLVTRSSEEAKAVFEGIQDVADRTRSGFSATADLYTRLALATKDLSISQKQALSLTESLNQAVILSGATAREAEAAILQFSQGLASNRLAGDELRAVLEQLPLIADVIADKLNVTRGAIRYLAKEGAIDAKVIVQAFQEAAPKLAQQFEKTMPTVGQSINLVHNALLRVLKDLDDSTGIFGKLSGVILFVAKNMDTFARVVLAGTVVGALLLVEYALGLITAAIVANPLGLLALSITSAIALLVTFSDQILIGADSITNLWDVIVVMSEDVQAVLSDMVNSIVGGLPAIAAQGNLSFVDLMRIAGFAIDSILNFFVGLWVGIKSGWNAMSGPAKTSFAQIANFAATAVEKVLNIFIGLGKALSKIFDAVSTLFKDAFGGVFDIANDLGKAFDEFKNGSFEQGLVNIANAQERFANGLVNNFGSLETGFLSKLADAGDIIGEEIDKKWIPRINEIFEDGGGDAGAAFVRGFESAAAGRVVQDYLDGVIDRAQARAKIREIQRAQEKAKSQGVSDDPSEPSGRRSLRDVVLERFTDRLKQETANLQLSNRERGIQDDLLKAELALKKDIGQLSASEREEIEFLFRRKDALEGGEKALRDFYKILPKTDEGFALLGQIRQTFNEKITSVLDDLRNGNITIDQANQSIDSLTDAISRQAQLYERIQDPAALYEQRLADIAEVSKLVKTDSEKLTLELEKTRAKIDSLSNDRTVTGGFTRGFLELQDQITNFSATAENALVSAFNNARDAMAEFVVKGKADFSSLVDSILSDLTKLLLDQALYGPLLNAIGSGLGGGDLSGSFSLFGGFRASGGPVDEGKSYVVGEDGPEIFRPSTDGTIIPNGATTTSAPKVNVTVVNVTDKDEIAKALSDPSIDRVLINAIGRNPDAIRRVLRLGGGG